jgi:hypothetical protein
MAVLLAEVIYAYSMAHMHFTKFDRRICCRIFRALYLTLLAASVIQGQILTSSGLGASQPATSDDVLARIAGDAPAPTNGVSTNLVPVPEGTVYYGDATKDNLYEGK